MSQNMRFFPNKRFSENPKHNFFSFKILQNHLSEGHATTTTRARASESESESERDDRAGSRRGRW